MKCKKLLSALLVAILICLPLSACKPDTGKTKIRLSEVTHSIFYAPLYVALNQGFFDEYDLDVTVANVGGSDKVMTALTSKSADIGLTGPETTI